MVSLDIEAARAQQIREEIEAKLIQGLNSPSELMRDEEWDNIRRAGEKLLDEKRPG